MELARFLARLIAGIMSIMDASNLRNRLYEQKEEHELMWTALDDIRRMHHGHPAAAMADRTLEQVKTRYGR
jgi:hypothetical protein